MAGWMLIGVYCVLFVATNITNKYVLSVLHFTYPTLFQEWQTLVGIIVLYGIANRGYIKLTYDRSALVPWLPAMMFFVLSIYSGSKALSTLVIPAFVTVSNIVDVPSYMIGNFLRNQSSSFLNKISLVSVVTAAVLTWVTDPQRGGEGYDEGYYWMLVYVVSSSGYAVYSTVRGVSSDLSDVDKLFYCYLFSVVALSPASIILGDFMAAKDFPHWYLHRFYMGCVLSGVFGVCTNLTSICMGRSPNPSPLSRLAVVYAKAAVVLASVVLFDGTYTRDFALSVFLGVSALAVFTITKATSNAIATDNKHHEALRLESI